MKVAIILLAAIMAVSGCIGQIDTSEGPPTVGEEIPGATAGLLAFELQDVRTGQTFRLSDFAGNVVIVETFAVWCPQCLDQQRQIQKAEEKLGRDDVISVSLDIDPNEDSARVLGHLNLHGFDWRFAISPPEMSKLLADNFGFLVLNPPSTPVLILDRDQNFHLLRFGVKNSAEMISEIQKYL